MKGILCACLLASLQSLSPAWAYEADIHYSTTYVLARAVGWSQADALTIASANQAVDENQDTVAALEMETISSPSPASYVTSSLHQAERNLRFHCFSETRGEAGLISADVRAAMSAHFAEVPARDEDPRSHARRLIALGTALHCQQDAYSHAGFGGSCGPYSGSCYGHSYETVLDQLVFGLLRKHRFNPDHPGVSGERILAAIQGSASALLAHRPKASSRPIPAGKLVALADALRGSGLELPDDVRRDCNRQIAGRWLFEFLQSAGRSSKGADAVGKLAPEVAVTCRNASLASAHVIRIPGPRFPRLNADASPTLVSADGTYQLIRDGGFDTALPGIQAPDNRARSIKVQLSHWSQLLALPLVVQAALGNHDVH